jgi:hypothetical protein
MEGATVLRLSLFGVIVAALAGCAQSELIVLKNPTTGEIKECSKNSGASFFPIAQTMMDNTAARSCAAGYQAAGFVRLN